MLYDYLKELLYNNATPTTSLAEISPTDFVKEYRNNPELASYFDKTAKWSESIGDPRLFISNTSEYNFLAKLREALGVDSHASTISNSVPQLNVPIIPQGEIEGIRLAKLDEIIKYLECKYDGASTDLIIIDKIRNFIDSYDYIQLLSMSNNSEIINYINSNMLAWVFGVF